MRDDKPAFTSTSGLVITKADFDKARKFVKPSAMREGFATVPDVTWNDIGALVNVRKTLEMSFLVRVIRCCQFTIKILAIILYTTLKCSMHNVIPIFRSLFGTRNTSWTGRRNRVVFYWLVPLVAERR